MKSPVGVRAIPAREEATPRFGTRSTRTLALALALAVAFFVGACTYGAQAVGGDAGEMTLNVAAPVDGAEVAVPFEVSVESDVAIGPPESGNHHLHLYFDGGTEAADYDVVYSNPVQVSRPLAPGEHTIIVSLRNPDHSSAGASQTITVVVAGGDAGGETADPAAAPSGYGY